MGDDESVEHTADMPRCFFLLFSLFSLFSLFPLFLFSSFPFLLPFHVPFHLPFSPSIFSASSVGTRRAASKSGAR